MKQVKFIIKHLKNNSLKMVVLMASGVLIVTFTLLTPLFFSYFIDTIIGDIPSQNHLFNFLVNQVGGLQIMREHLWLAGVLLVSLSLVSGIFMIVRGYLNGAISEDVVMNIRHEMFNHIAKLPYGVFVKHQSGDLIQRTTSDVETIRRFLAAQVSEFVYALSMALLSALIMFSINPQLAWLSIIALPIIFFFAFFYFKQMQRAFKASDEAEAEMSNTIQENLSGVRVVKAFNNEAYEMEKFTQKNATFRDLTYRLIHLLARYWAISDFVCLLQILVVVVVGIYFALHQRISVGQYFVFVSYVSMVLWPVRNMGRILSDMGKVSVSIDRLMEILDVPMEDVDTGLTPTIAGNISFENVSFKYDDGITHVLHDVSFKIQQGERIAIMGPTGSGKSSLVHLLLRLYEPTQGRIYVDDVPLDTMALKHVRQNISIVLQEPYLFSRSIKENIKIAHPYANDDQVAHVATIANIDEVIESFESGYDTLVGERGVTLSGGQKQRVAIARSILANAPVLIFDDSLSAVDAQTDQEIQRALQNIAKDVTTIVVTHRINSAKTAHRILVIDQGRIVQEGSHEQLLKTPGLYQTIAKIQESEDHA
ncbi:MAG: ABC transporter ATP-binding protein [Erysipelothrix sp.]|nr:ABC transporter ATP-binding protein [Erysipelothrix sp.]